MAFQQKENKSYSPSVYGYSFSNPVSTVDQTNLSFTMWRSTLKISIAPKINDGNEENATYDYKSAISIYLNHTKARILSQLLLQFNMIVDEAEKEKYNRSVQSGSGLITVCTGKMYGIDSAVPLLVIRKVGSDGKVEASSAYEFKTNYNRSIDNFNEETGSYTDNYEEFKDMEILQVITMLTSYADAMTNTTAFSVVDTINSVFDFNSSLAKIAGKLGVDLTKNSGYKSKNYFSNSNSNSGGESVGYTTANVSTTDDLEDLG